MQAISGRARIAFPEHATSRIIVGVATLLDRGHEMLLRKQIGAESALSKDMFDTALRQSQQP